MTSEKNPNNKKTGYWFNIFSSTTPKAPQPIELPHIQENNKFSSYETRIKISYENYKNKPCHSEESRRQAREKLWEDNINTFIDLYKDIYGVDLKTTTDSKNIKSNMESLLASCNEQTMEVEKSSFAFTYARDDIQKSISMIIKSADNRKDQSVAANAAAKTDTTLTG